MLNRQTKISELLIIKYIKTAKLFVIESHHQVFTSLKFQCYITAQRDKTN